MQITDDDKEQWLAAGYIAGAIRFNVSVVKANERPNGHRVRMSVSWANKPALAMHPLIQRLLYLANLEYKDEWTKQEDVMKWIVLLDGLDMAYKTRTLIADRAGLHMFCWVWDNPAPTDYEEFIEWAKAFDDEEAALG